MARYSMPQHVTRHAGRCRCSRGLLIVGGVQVFLFDVIDHRLL